MSICAGKELQGRKSACRLPRPLMLIQLDIYTEESYPYVRSPYINACSSNTIEWGSGMQFNFFSFFSIYGFLGDGEFAQEWALTQHSTHLLSMCRWVTHTFLVTKSNKYLFSPWQSHRAVATEGKTSEIPFSCAHRKITIDAMKSCPEESKENNLGKTNYE